MGFDVSVDDVYQARDRVHQTGLSTKDYPTPEQMEHYWLVYFKCLLKELAITNKLEQCTIRLKEEFRYYSGTYLYPEVPYVLSTLKARGHAVGIISNISCMLPAYLEQLGISGHLDFAIASASFGASNTTCN